MGADIPSKNMPGIKHCQLSAWRILLRFTKKMLCRLFLISDSILAINKFKSPLPLRGYLVWATYYLAQYGIAIGFLREKLGKR